MANQIKAQDPAVSVHHLPFPSSVMAAAILRTRSTLLSSATAPPPSPIATGKGLRSAAVNDPILSQFLHNSLKIPELTLPPSYLGRIGPRIPEEIDLASLVNGDQDSLYRLLGSAAGLGVFQIVGHGVSPLRIGDAIRASDQVFGGVPKWRKLEMDGYFGQGRGPNGVREDLCWFGSGAAGKEMEERLAQYVGAETVKMFRENMGKLFAELEAVAEKVGGMLSKHARKQQQGMKRIQKQESVLCVHKCSSSDDIHQEHEINPAVPDGLMESDEEPSHAFLLHVSDRDLEFRVRSNKGSFSFSASAGAIVVTFGQQLQEWSHGEMKICNAEPILDFGTDANPYFCLQFGSSPSSLNYGLDHTLAKTLSLVDQMLILLIVAILFAFFSTKWASPKVDSLKII